MATKKWFRWLAILLLCLTMVHTAAPIAIAGTRYFDPRTPPDGHWIHYDYWGQVQGIWNCKDFPTSGEIWNVCGWEDVFPMPQPNGVIPTPGYVWRCIPNTWAISPIEKVFLKGSCLFLASDLPGSFTPTSDQVSQALNDAEAALHRMINIPPDDPEPPQRRLPDWLKSAAGLQANVQSGIDKIISYVAIGCGAIRIVNQALACALVAKGYVDFGDWVAELNRKIAKDPVDTNYTTIALPIAPPFIPISLADGVSQQDADIGNALLVNVTQQIGLLRAILTALDRAQGAAQAYDTFWENRQLQAAYQYNVQLGALLAVYADQLIALKNAFKEVNLHLQVTSDAILQMEQYYITNTLSLTTTQRLIESGAQSSTINNIRIARITQDPKVVVGWGDGIFPDALTDSAVIDTIKHAAESFRQGGLQVEWQVNLAIIQS